MRALLTAFLLFPALAGAADLRAVTVDRVDGAYVMRSEVWFDVSIDKIYGVFLDWDLSTKFSSVVVESRDVEPGEDGRPRFYNRNQACILFFCKSFERFGYVSYEPLKYIEASADPDKSDFHLSDERWEFREEENGTVVVYDLKFKPKFFIPPLIGPAVMKHKLRTSSVDALDRIEAVAQEWTPNDD